MAYARKVFSKPYDYWPKVTSKVSTAVSPPKAPKVSTPVTKVSAAPRPPAPSKSAGATTKATKGLGAAKAERGENIPDKEFRKLVDEITGLGKQKIDIRVDYLNQLEGLLTNTQRVKLLVFEDQFRNELKKNVFDRRTKAEYNKRMMGKYKRDAKRY